MTEDVRCQICGAVMKPKQNFIFKRKTCTQKCRTIKWALNEANKVMVKK